MDTQSLILLISAFVVGWLVGGVALVSPQIATHLKQKRRRKEWLRLTADEAAPREVEYRTARRRSH